MIRKLFTVSILLVLLLAFASPAFAITYGQPDGNAHPEVGSMVLRVPAAPEAHYYQVCSGTLIAPQVFLTASHCTVGWDAYFASHPGAEMLVTFDPTIAPTSTYYSGEMVTNPAYGGGGENDSNDVAVILLDAAPPGITPAQLPTAGLLDELQDEHLLKDSKATAVGYGTVRDTNRTGWQALLDNMDRNKAEQTFQSLTGAWITYSMNLATGNGGTCYGDSGGPHFIWLNGAETNIVAAITVTGDYQCKSTDKDYRMDTVSARSFLGKYVSLP